MYLALSALFPTKVQIFFESNRSEDQKDVYMNDYSWLFRKIVRKSLRPVKRESEHSKLFRWYFSYDS